MKKIAIYFLTAMFLFTALPKKDAKAGIILAPAGVGIVIIVLGVVYDSWGLIILNEENTTSKISAQLQEKYGHLTSNTKAFNKLGALISSKLPNEVKEEIEIKLTQEEIYQALGSAAANEELVYAVSQDLM